MISSPKVACLLFLLISIHSIESFSSSEEERGGDGQGKMCKFINKLLAKNKPAEGHPKGNNNNHGKNDTKLEAYKRVIDLASQRLDLAQPVALYKWQNNQSIDDPVREAALLASVATQANASGLSAQFAQEFFQDQINASKIIQFAYFALWESNGAPNVTAPDLATVTRPLINNVTSALVQALVPVQTIRLGKKCSMDVEKGLKELVKAEQIGTNPVADRPKALCVALAHLCQRGNTPSSE